MRVPDTRTPHRALLTNPKYRPDIDGLRAVAVLLVIGFHAFPLLVWSGFVGVDIFFVISGFLISTIIFENLEAGSFSYKDFYARRVRRIAPALLVVLLACLAFGWIVLLHDEFRRLGKHVFGGTAFASNFILWNESGYFDTTSDTKPLLHLWSLGIEEQFYIFWPLLMGVVWKRKTNFLMITVIVALASFGLNLAEVLRDPVGAFYSPLTRVWELMVGGGLAYIKLHRPGVSNLYPNWQSVIGALLLLAGFCSIRQNTPYPGGWALLPTIGSFFLISAGPTAFINRTLLANRAAVWLGLVSYPLYLWHWPLLVWVKVTTGTQPTPMARVVVIGLVLLLAWLTYRFVELPIRRTRTPIAPPLLAGLATLCAVSIAVASGTLPSRQNSAELENILVARLDWVFPGDEFRRILDSKLRYFSAGAAPEATLYFGDSNMEQYAPRLNALIKKGREQHRAILVGNQERCRLVEELVSPTGKCADAIADLTQLMRGADVNAVVFAASWQGVSQALLSNAGYERLRQFVEGIPPGRHIYIVLNIPNGNELDPRNMFEGSRFTTLRAKPIANLRFDTKEFQDRLEPVHARLRRLAEETGAVVIDPLDTLCPGNRCPVVDPAGRPLYHDAAHLTATYAARAASYIDVTLRSDRGR